MSSDLESAFDHVRAEFRAGRDETAFQTVAARFQLDAGRLEAAFDRQCRQWEADNGLDVD